MNLRRQLNQQTSNAFAKKINLIGEFSWKKRKAYFLLSLVSIAVGVLSGCQTDLSQPIAPSETSSPTSANNEAQNQSDRPLTPTAEGTNFVVEVVKKVSPAVVQINTARTIKTQVPQLPGVFNDPFFRRFFGEVPIQPQERVVRGLGSGFVIDSSGRILTNAHVVNNADTVTVSFSDGRTFEGKVLGQDPISDIAVVQIPGNNNFPTVGIANSNSVQSGQWVVAIGNPLGLQQTVTVGVISAIDRSLNLSTRPSNYIQTDAAINPGNSGGPLLNARGQVLGVNTAIIQGAEGIGFAIPIDTAQRIAQQLITEGKVEYPYIGIEMLPITPEVKQRINNSPNSNIRIEADRGLLIANVIPNSPAAKAGLRAGDVIQEINNQPVTTANEILQILDKNGVGSNLQIEVQRNRQTLQFTLQPVPLPPQSNTNSNSQ
ncbi:peptidase S1 [Scytonema hofmannii PCC 7110]|uniref:Peptidase S1 n=2 Tax=Scytonema hofmannii TaxID=34078 RepID=A0A139XG95_9CYAN|nr:peptidase S1 [Scytonema hofmannii PCC 7110]